MKKFFKSNWPAIFIFLLLFIIPSFWFKQGEVDYGGDSTRIYFYNPLSWLKNIALYLINPLSGLGRDMPNFFMIPFLLFFSLLKALFFHSGYSLNNFFNGLLLGGGFFSVYLIVKEILLYRSEEDFNDNDISYPSIISGLFFILSPLLVFQWERSLYSIGYLFIYPLTFLLFLRYLHSKKFFYLTLIPIVSLLFSVNFSYATIPWLLAFFLPGASFLFFYSIILKKTKLFIKGFVVICILMAAVMSFDYIIQVYNLISPFGLSNRMMFDKNITTNRSLEYFLSVRSHVRLIYNLLNQDQFVLTGGTGSPFLKTLFNFGVKFLPIFVIYPVILSFGVIFSKIKLSLVKQKIYFLVLTVFLVMLFFMTANITNLGVSFYKSLFRLPWFGMFRSFYSKFAMVYVFFYSLLLGYSLNIFLKGIKSSIKKSILWSFLFFLVIFNGWPLLSGKMAEGTLWRSKNVPYANQIDPAYQEFIDRLKEEKSNFKVWSFPFANEDYQVLQGKAGGVYFGPSTIPILTGKNTFSGQVGLGLFWPYLQNLVDKNETSQTKRLLSFLNIGYVFYNSDDYIYNNFPNYPYSDWLKQSYTTQEKVRKLVDSFGFEKIYSINSYNLYKLKEENLLPLFYIPRKILSSGNGIEILPAVLNFADVDPRAGFFLDALTTGPDLKNVNIDRQPADNYYIRGENREISDLEMKYQAKNRGIAYPSAFDQKSGSWLSFFVERLLDKIKLFVNSSPVLISEKLLQANTALNKAIFYKKNEKQYFMAYRKNILEAFEAVKNEEDPDKKTDLIFSFKYNLEDNLARLNRDKPVNYEDWQKLVENFLKELASFTPVTDINFREYTLNIPKSLNYTFFLEGATPFLTTVIADSMEGCGLNLKDATRSSKLVKLKLDFDKNDDKNYWLDLGNYHFLEGTTKVKLEFCRLRNLLEDNDWSVFQSSPEKDKLKIEGYQLPFAKKYFYKSIENWESDTWYDLKGEVKGNNKVMVVIGEERNRWTAVHKKVKLLRQFDVVNVFEIDTDPGGTSFDFQLKSSAETFSAKIFVYPVTNGAESDVNDFLEMGKVSILPILDPKLFLRSVDGDEEIISREIPRLTFYQINPTKYKVKIEGADKPYSLIFSQYFHPEWKIYPVSNLEFLSENKRKGVLGKIGTMLEKIVGNFWENDVSNEIIAEYFNGGIKEGDRKSAFLEPITFETWGKQPIAENSHLMVNGYANSWYIKPSDVGEKKDYELIIEFIPQRTLYIGILMGGLTLLGCFLFSLFNFILTRNIKNNEKNP